MEDERIIITDLHDDLLMSIMRCLSDSSDGPQRLVMLSASCKSLRKRVEEDPMVLKSLTFKDVLPYSFDKSFWSTHGLLFRCIRAGNLNAFALAIRHLGIILSRASMDVRVVADNVSERMLLGVPQHDPYNRSARKRLHSAVQTYHKALDISKELENAVKAVFSFDIYKYKNILP